MPPFGCADGEGHAGGAATHHGDAPSGCRRPVGKLDLVPGTRIDHARRRALGEDIVQACLITADTGVDTVGPVFANLARERRISEERSGHGDKIRRALSKQQLARFGHIEAIRRDDRNRDSTLDVFDCETPGGARHGAGDGRDCRLVPANARVEQVNASVLQRARIGRGLSARHPAVDQVNGRNPEDDEESFACRRPDCPDGVDRQSNAVVERSAEFVVTRVGERGRELVKKVALGTHDFNAVIARLSCHGRGLRNGFDR